jgi:hypothetical protein
VFTEDLFTATLLKPELEHGCTELLVVSGYVVPSMFQRHISALSEAIGQPQNLRSISAIYGMATANGVGSSNHKVLKSQSSNGINGVQTVTYYPKLPNRVHSKVYCWLKDSEPVVGFVGSANYTQRAFSSLQKEVLIECDAKTAFNYYQSILLHTISCDSAEVENHVEIHNDLDVVNKVRARSQQRAHRPGHLTPNEYDVVKNEAGIKYVNLSLCMDDETIPERSGLNWGQRDNREPNQAYIAIPAPVGRTDFFPQYNATGSSIERRYFTVVADDGEQFTMVRAQANGKALHTSDDNSILGRYFRKRLGLGDGSLIRYEDLVKYGRTYISIYKFDEETYYLDFSPLNA